MGAVSSIFGGGAPSSGSKRSAEDAGFEDEQAAKRSKNDEPAIDQADIEDAHNHIRQKAALDYERLVNKAKTHFRRRNAREATDEEISGIIGTLKDKINQRMLGADDSSGDSADEDENAPQDGTNLEADVTAAYRAASQQGTRDSAKLKDRIKKLWIRENGGGEPTKDQVSAVLFNIRTKATGAIPIESEAESDADYTLGESEDGAESEDAPTEKPDVGFDFDEQTVPASEDKVEAEVEAEVEDEDYTPAKKQYSCPKNCELESHEIETKEVGEFCCDVCDEEIALGITKYSCDKCDWDCCNQCMNESEPGKTILHQDFDADDKSADYTPEAAESEDEDSDVSVDDDASLKAPPVAINRQESDISLAG